MANRVEEVRYDLKVETSNSKLNHIQGENGIFLNTNNRTEIVIGPDGKTHQFCFTE